MVLPGSIRCVLSWFFLLAGVRAEVVISEFLADNKDGLTDADGAHPDWIELENRGPSAVNLAGWFLTDDAQTPMKWQFPAVSLAADARLVVFASGKDRTNPAAVLHTNFQLQNSGEYLALIKPDGVTKTTEFAPQYPPQRPDISYGAGLLVVSDDLVHAGTAGKFLSRRTAASGRPGPLPDLTTRPGRR